MQRRMLVSDLEAALAAHLNGNFFWEPTTNLDEPDAGKDALEIRRAQKAFSRGAKQVTARKLAAERAWEVNPPPPPKKREFKLSKDQEMIGPILNAIATAYGVDTVFLMGRATNNRQPNAKRHMYWAMMRYIPGATFAGVARLMGKDHSTVIHGYNAFKKNLDPEKIAEVDRLMGWL